MWNAFLVCYSIFSFCFLFQFKDGHVQCKKEICPSTGNCYVVLQQNKSAAKCCQVCKGKKKKTQLWLFFFSFFVASHHRLSPLKCQMSLVVDRTGPRLYVPTPSARPPESSKRETDYAGLTGRNVQLILYTGTLPYHFDRQKTKGKLDSFLVFFFTQNKHTRTHTQSHAK